MPRSLSITYKPYLWIIGPICFWNLRFSARYKIPHFWLFWGPWNLARGVPIVKKKILQKRYEISVSFPEALDACSIKIPYYDTPCVVGSGRKLAPLMLHLQMVNTVVISDFGLCREHDDDKDCLGCTPGWSAPEQSNLGIHIPRNASGMVSGIGHTDNYPMGKITTACLSNWPSFWNLITTPLRELSTIQKFKSANETNATLYEIITSLLQA